MPRPARPLLLHIKKRKNEDPLSREERIKKASALRKRPRQLASDDHVHVEGLEGPEAIHVVPLRQAPLKDTQETSTASLKFATIAPVDLSTLILTDEDDEPLDPHVVAKKKVLEVARNPKMQETPKEQESGRPLAPSPLALRLAPPRATGPLKPQRIKELRQLLHAMLAKVLFLLARCTMLR